MSRHFATVRGSGSGRATAYEAWGRIFARGYDRVLGLAERAGLAERRRELLRAARGETLEIGAGTGANVGLYPDAVTRLVLSEPDPYMVRTLERKLKASGHRPEVVRTGGEQLPFADASFDTVVFTMVLCTVPDPMAMLREVARVVRPDGTVLFFEHVRSESPRLARWQERLYRPWRWFGHGCRCNQRTEALLRWSPLVVDWLEYDEIPRITPLVKPLIVGAGHRAPVAPAGSRSDELVAAAP